jgi:hypothetical protein
MKKFLALCCFLFIVNNSFAAMLKPPRKGSNGDKDLKRTLSASDLEKVEKERAREHAGKERWFFKFPGVTRSEYTKGEEIRDILARLRSLWDDTSTRPVLEYFKYFLKREFPKSFSQKDKDDYDKILFEKNLIESDKSVKKIVRLVCEAALSNVPKEILLWSDLTNREIVRSQSVQEDIDNSVKDYEPGGDLYVFKIKDCEREFQTTKERMKETFKQFAKLNEEERLSFNDLVEGSVVLSRLTFIIQGNKEKLNKEILDYYRKNGQPIPQKVNDLLEVIKRSVENIKTHLDLLNKEISKEDPRFVDRIKSLVSGVIKSEESLEKGNAFKIKVKELGLMRDDNSISYLVKYLWKILFNAEKKEIMRLDDVFGDKIYKQK